MMPPASYKTQAFRYKRATALVSRRRTHAKKRMSEDVIELVAFPDGVLRTLTNTLENLPRQRLVNRHYNILLLQNTRLFKNRLILH